MKGRLVSQSYNNRAQKKGINCLQLIPGGNGIENIHSYLNTIHGHTWEQAFSLKKI